MEKNVQFICIRQICYAMHLLNININFEILHNIYNKKKSENMLGSCQCFHSALDRWALVQMLTHTHIPHDVLSNSPNVVKLVLRPALISSGFSHTCVAMETYTQTTLISPKLSLVKSVEWENKTCNLLSHYHFTLTYSCS